MTRYGMDRAMKVEAANRQSSDFITWFRLRDNGDTARFRILSAAEEGMRTVEPHVVESFYVHSVQSEDKRYWSDRICEKTIVEGETPVGKCRYCDQGNQLKFGYAIWVYVYDFTYPRYTAGAEPVTRAGETVYQLTVNQAMPWLETRFGVKGQIQGLYQTRGTFSDADYVLIRNGAKGSMDTSFQLFPNAEPTLMARELQSLVLPPFEAVINEEVRRWSEWRQLADSQSAAARDQRVMV